MKVSRETLHQLIANKLNTAGLTRNHADIIADVLVYADARVFIRTARFALNIMRNVFQKAEPIVIPPSPLKRTAPAAVFCMPIMPPVRWPPKWAWSTR